MRALEDRCTAFENQPGDAKATVVLWATAASQRCCAPSRNRSAAAPKLYAAASSAFDFVGTRDAVNAVITGLATDAA